MKTCFWPAMAMIVSLLFVAGCQSAEKKRSVLVEQHLKLAEQKNAMKDRSGAMKELNDVLAIDPESQSALVRRGRIFSDMGNDDAALRDFNSVLELNSANLAAYVGIAEVQKRQKDYAAALANLQKALELVPDMPGDTMDAETRDATRVIQAAIVMSRGEVYASTGEFDRAIQDFTHAIELRPELYRAYQLRANAYVATGDKKRALADLKVIRENSRDTDMLSRARQLTYELTAPEQTR